MRNYRIFIRPASDKLLVLDPISRQPVPKEGDWYRDLIYWRRREAEGSIIIEDEEPLPPLPEMTQEELDNLLLEMYGFKDKDKGD